MAADTVAAVASQTEPMLLLPLWSTLPFVGLLLSIALFPILAPRSWHHHFEKIALGWSVVFVIPYLAITGNNGIQQILHSYLKEYIPFIILLWSLYTVAGGILIDGFPNGTPLVNTVVLGFGTLIASWVGTTGASMLLVRPLLRMNRQRKNKAHIMVFFIILVGNIGGALTPLGDPPLLLGFFSGVPFFWPLSLLPYMLAIALPVLLLFFCVDAFFSRREQTDQRRHHGHGEKYSDTVKIRGIRNVLLLLCIVSITVLSGKIVAGEYALFGVHMAIQDSFRDVVLLAIGLISLGITRTEVRQKNGFNWFPIKEVAVLFAAIFITIIPLLVILRAGAQGPLAELLPLLNGPCRYFWACGVLSSVLDNAPTYMAFLSMQLGAFGQGLSSQDTLKILLNEKAVYLEAISCGAVFMGALTYIGNAPNFLVKSIAEENTITMPGFFMYMLYAGSILAPGFLLVSFLFCC